MPQAQTMDERMKPGRTAARKRAAKSQKIKAKISVNDGPEYDADSAEAKEAVQAVIIRARVDLDESETPHRSVTRAAIKGDAKDVGGVAGVRLRSFLERIERMDDEIKALGADRKDIYAEAKGVGFDVATIKRIVKLRKMEPDKIREQDDMLELYKAALGMG